MLLNPHTGWHDLVFSLPTCELLIALFLFWNITIAGAIIRTIIQLERQQRIAAELALENAKLETCLKNAELEALSGFDPRRFLRIHRRHIVNTGRILAVHPLAGGTFEIEMQHGVRLTSGRNFTQAVRLLIGR